MKKFIFSLIILTLALTIPIPKIEAQLMYDQAWYQQNVGSIGARSPADPVWRHLGEVQDLFSVGSSTGGTGDNFYVDSGVSSSGVGTSWDTAVATFDEAVALCTANEDDNIHIQAGHAETWALTTSGATLDIIGINVIGHGKGTDAPTFTYTHAGATIDITVANVSIHNLRFVSGVSAVVSSMTLAAGADNLTVSGCEWVTPGTAEFEFYDMITLASGSDYVTIVGNTFASLTTTTGCNHAINADAGVVNRLKVVGNEFSGQFIVAGIHSDDIDLNIVIASNIFHNSTTTQHAIEFTAAATGVCAYNLMYTDTIASTLNPGSLACYENYGINTTDLTAILIPAPPALSVQTQTAGSIGDILAKMYYAADGTGAFPATLANDSALAMIMANGSTATASTYNNTTDSLEALGDHTKTLITVGAGTGTAPTGITNESILAFIMASGATATASTFDNTTDSLQAISDKITALEGVNFMMTATSAGAAATFISTTGGDGFGDHYFNTGWAMIITYDAGAIGGAPEGDVRDIVAYTSTTGTFTVAPVWSGSQSTASGDKAIVVRHADLNPHQVAQMGGSGRILYVDASQPGTPDTGDIGDIWDLSYTTIATAIAGATASNGDVINVAAGHTETIGAAQLTWNVAGLKIIGRGVGSTMPVINFDDAASSIDVTAPDIYVEGFRFTVETDDVLVGLDLAGTADGFHIKNCIFDADTATDEFLETIEFGAAAAGSVTIEGCEFYADDTANATEAIISETGASDNTKIIGNTFIGSWVVSPIWSDQVHTNALIKDNVVQNFQTGQHAIELTGAWTGSLVDNTMHGDTITAILDPGSLICNGNTGSISINEAGITLPLSADTTGVAEEDDGSDLERLEYLQNKSEDILAMLRATGGNIGNVFYVDSVTGSAAGGTTWETAEATLALGYAKATANKGDIVFMAANHGETVAAAVALATAGVQVIGIGYGDDRPLITMTAALSSFDIGAADNLFENIVFYSTTINTTIGIDVADAGDGFILRNCEFTDTGGFEFDSCIDVKASADRVTIEGNRFIGGAAGTQAILNTAGVTDRMTVVDNYIYGNYSAAGIFSDDADTHVLVKDNIVSNLDTGAHAIEFSAAALGQCIDNYLMGDTYGAILDPGSMRCFGNLQCLDIDSGAIDVPLIAGKTYAISVAADEVTQNLLDIQNGGIMIHSIFAEVDVVIGAVATNAKINVDAGDGAAWDTDLSTAVAITDDVAGTRWFMDDGGIGTNPPVLDPRKGGATEGTLSASPSMYVPEGLLIQTMDANPAGAGGDHVTWYITFSPLEDGVVVVPQ